jgi:hypothetical protein
MKKSFLFVVLLAICNYQTLFAQDGTKEPYSQLLTAYYGIKDALVNGHASAAASSATSFIQAVNAANNETVKDEIRSSLLKDANKISQSKDLTVQREMFATLSTTMIALAKSVKLSPEPVYLQYCPMKKSSWLSNTKAIKNPYYGNAMLTCGNVKETL